MSESLTVYLIQNQHVDFEGYPQGDARPVLATADKDRAHRECEPAYKATWTGWRGGEARVQRKCRTIEVEDVPSRYEYRVFEKQGGHRVGERLGGQPVPTDSLEDAEDWRRSADFIPKSGSWHIERREVGEWEEF